MLSPSDQKSTNGRHKSLKLFQILNFTSKVGSLPLQPLHLPLSLDTLAIRFGLWCCCRCDCHHRIYDIRLISKLSSARFQSSPHLLSHGLPRLQRSSSLRPHLQEFAAAGFLKSFTHTSTSYIRS